MMRHRAYGWGLILGLLLFLPGPLWGVAQLINGDRTHAGATNYQASTGPLNAYVLTLNAAIPAYAPGSCYLFKAHLGNTGPVTLNVNGKGALAITKFVGGVPVPLSSGEISPAQLVRVCYDGAAFQTDSIGGAGAGGGTGDLATIGSCNGPDCFTDPNPSDSLTFKNATSGTIKLQTVSGALSTNVARLKAETGDICTDASVCAGYQAAFPTSPMTRSSSAPRMISTRSHLKPCPSVVMCSSLKIVRRQVAKSISRSDHFPAVGQAVVVMLRRSALVPVAPVILRGILQELCISRRQQRQAPRLPAVVRSIWIASARTSPSKMTSEP